MRAIISGNLFVEPPEAFGTGPKQLEPGRRRFEK
jgi:hypothetical protein